MIDKNVQILKTNANWIDDVFPLWKFQGSPANYLAPVRPSWYARSYFGKNLKISKNFNGNLFHGNLSVNFREYSRKLPEINYFKKEIPHNISYSSTNFSFLYKISKQTHVQNFFVFIASFASNPVHTLSTSTTPSIKHA